MHFAGQPLVRNEPGNFAAKLAPPPAARGGLTDFDIFAEAGGRYRALVKERRSPARDCRRRSITSRSPPANVSGQIVVVLAIGSNNFPGARRA
jgi:hypothetical protein